MNEVLDVIEREILRGVHRHNGRARRRQRNRVALAVSCGLLVVASAGSAAIPGSLIDRLLDGDSPNSQVEGTPRIDLEVADASGFRWTTATYHAKDGTLASTATSQGGQADSLSVGGANGFVIADNLLEGPLASNSLRVVRANGQRHYLYAGTVDAHAEQVIVEFAGQTQSSVLAADVMSVPVEADDASLTREGERRAAQMPVLVRIKPFAVAFASGAASEESVVRANITVVMDDGKTRTQESAPFCVSASCGVKVPDLD